MVLGDGKRNGFYQRWHQIAQLGNLCLTNVWAVRKRRNRANMEIKSLLVLEKISKILLGVCSFNINKISVAGIEIFVNRGYMLLVSHGKLKTEISENFEIDERKNALNQFDWLVDRFCDEFHSSYFKLIMSKERNYHVFFSI